MRKPCLKLNYFYKRGWQPHYDEHGMPIVLAGRATHIMTGEERSDEASHARPEAKHEPVVKQERANGVYTFWGYYDVHNTWCPPNDGSS